MLMHIACAKVSPTFGSSSCPRFCNYSEHPSPCVWETVNRMFVYSRCSCREVENDKMDGTIVSILWLFRMLCKELGYHWFPNLW